MTVDAAIAACIGDTGLDAPVSVAAGDPEAVRASNVMERYARGEEAAFAELYAAITPRLFRFCLRLCARQGEADDLFQEALLRLHRARASYTPGAPVMQWAFAIARSAYIDRLRHDRRHPSEVLEEVAEDDAPSSVDPSEASPESNACARVLLGVVGRELRRMSEKNRTAYVLLREEGLSVAEAAEVLGTSCDVVKQRAHRAYELVRAALRRAGWDGDTR